jgi:oligosaccharyltransferase complex subunit beta
LTFKSPRASDIALFELGERAHDHVILLPPTGKAYGEVLNPKSLLDFINADGNVLLALTGEKATPAAINALLLELDVSLPPERTSVVVDHFSYDTSSASEQHDVLVVDAPSKPVRPDLRNFFANDAPLAVPRAVGQVLGNENPLLVPILRAPATAYTYNPKDKETDSVDDSDLFAAGSQIALASALQARNSARFTVLGSVEMLEDKWFDAKVKVQDGKSEKTGNQAFAKQITSWTFKEVGVLKVGELKHHLKAGSVDGDSSELNPSIYRVKNDVVSLQTRRRRTVVNIIRPLRLNSPSTLATSWSHSLLQHLMRSNLNSACCHLSIVLSSSQLERLPTLPSLKRPSHFPTNTESSTFASTTSDHSLPTSTKRDK